jgi:hypothetical protein
VIIAPHEAGGVLHALAHLVPGRLLANLATWGLLTLLILSVAATAAVIVKLRRHP